MVQVVEGGPSDSEDGMGSDSGSEDPHEGELREF